MCLCVLHRSAEDRWEWRVQGGWCPVVLTSLGESCSGRRGFLLSWEPDHVQNCSHFIWMLSWLHSRSLCNSFEAALDVNDSCSVFFTYIWVWVHSTNVSPDLSHCLPFPQPPQQLQAFPLLYSHCILAELIAFGSEAFISQEVMLWILLYLECTTPSTCRENDIFFTAGASAFFHHQRQQYLDSVSIINASG